ncbi:DUF6883 domain-containing protein [Anthocerotibacter panamensis]|uniref:DUF6883 domain-containing protein n=1 Tax=Anthocerotibacter panamensis TaxID=2857077 RepID=UPI001C40472B|nr:DUF6883 domain-containing protein [Anthocerotibacter panamensis]
MGWQQEYQARKTKKLDTSDTPVVSTRSAKAPQRKKEALSDLQTQQAQALHYGYNLSQVPVHPKHPTGAFGDTYQQEVAQPEEQVPASQEESSFIQPRFGFDFTKIRIDADPTTVSMSRERAAQAHSADIAKRVQRKEEEPIKSESSALNIAAMSSSQKLEAALQHTLPLLPAEVRTKVQALLSPEALATIAAVAGLWAASHAVGVGEIIDLVLLGLGALALGAEAFTVGQDIGGFVSTALQAQEEQDLDRAAEHLARAVATVGVDTVLALLTHKVGGAAKDRLPGQPEMVTPEGIRVRMPEAEHHTKPLAIEAKQGANSVELAATRASVDDKLARYLLNADHPIGSSKAKWFDSALGFNPDNADQLAKQIVFNEALAVQTAVIEQVVHQGVKFNQVIPITGANGKVINVTFGWIRNNDGTVRLTTAIPTKK